ncbi:MAG: hypothetical protein ACOX75_05615 [Lachnospiraceae bacterium]|jgi:hypothetical protein
MMTRTERPPKVRPPMDVGERAKQFAPYAALGSLEGAMSEIIDNHSTKDPERIRNFEDFNYLCAEDAPGIDIFEEDARK